MEAAEQSNELSAAVAPPAVILRFDPERTGAAVAAHCSRLLHSCTGGKA